MSQIDLESGTGALEWEQFAHHSLHCGGFVCQLLDLCEQGRLHGSHPVGSGPVSWINWEASRFLHRRTGPRDIYEGGDGIGWLDNYGSVHEDEC
jgi:hypothetical protein